MKKNVTLLLVFCAMLSASGIFAQSTFINEINYLSSNPTGQGLEIAGPAGQNLAGWIVAIYAPDGSMSSSRQLGSNVIPDQDNGHGSVWFEMEQYSGAQGFALINPVNSVVQFIGVGLGSISGITAVDGPAQGMTSQYAGTQLLPDNSLQLTGIGLTYLDFVWSLPLGMTPDDINTGQVFGLVRRLLWFLREAPAPSTNPLDQTIDSQINISVFPNPATHYVRLQRTASSMFSSTVPVYLLDINGRILQSTQLGVGEDYLDLDLSRLTPGTYLLKYGAGQGALLKRITKQ